MSDKRWTIYVCPSCSTVTDYDRPTGCGACEDGPMTVPVVVMPVAPVIPITTLREWIDALGADWDISTAHGVLGDLAALIEEHEGTSRAD